MTKPSSDDDVLARAVELTRPIDGLGDVTEQRIWRRLQASRQGTRGARRRFRRPALAAAVLVFVSGGALGAAAVVVVPRLVHELRAGVVSPEPRPPRATPAPTRSAARARADGAPSSAVTSPLPVASPPTLAPAAATAEPSREQSIDRRSMRVRIRGNPVAAAPPPATMAAAGPPPPAPPSSDAEEAAALGHILRTLRSDRTPTRALALLEEHQARWPAGQLAAEAERARIEALRSLGRDGEALARLERIGPMSARDRADAVVTRAELRRDAGDCTGALRDYGAVFATRDARASARERASFGRAVCQARLGDDDGARASFQRYLQEFPGGRFAAAASRALSP